MDDIETYSVAGLVAPHPLAAAAGRDVLIEGGNVIEAAIAAAAVSTVVVSHRNGMGGDALWLIREAGPRGRVRVLDARGRVRVLDARGLTGALAQPAWFRNRGYESVPLHGPDAVLAAPGAVAGWAAAHELASASGGRLPLSRLLAPALLAARDGFDLSPRDAAALAEAVPVLSAEPGFAAAFLDDGKAPDAGSRRCFPALAATLDHLARAGLDDVYRGDVGREIAVDLEAVSSPLTRDDLRRTEARWRQPLSVDVGRASLSVAPHRSGITLAFTLGLFSELDLARAEGLDHWHAMIESAKRAKHMFNAFSDAASEAEREELFTAERLARESLRVDRRKASRSAPDVPSPLVEDGIWIGAVARDGTAVSLVQTLGGAWGSGVVSRRTGVLFGNRGAGSSLDPASDRFLWPGRRPTLASVPVLASGRDGRVASVGATGPDAAVLASQLAARIMAGQSSGVSFAASRFRIGPAPEGAENAVLIDDSFDATAAARLRGAGHILTPVVAASLRTAGAASRLATGRVEVVSDDGDGTGV